MNVASKKKVIRRILRICNSNMNLNKSERPVPKFSATHRWVNSTYWAKQVQRQCGSQRHKAQLMQDLWVIAKVAYSKEKEPLQIRTRSRTKEPYFQKKGAPKIVISLKLMITQEYRFHSSVSDLQTSKYWWKAAIHNKESFRNTHVAQTQQTR